MNENGCNIDQMVELRRTLHSHPEGGFKEVKTNARLRQELMKMGIEEKDMKEFAKTGIVVDIWGQNKKISKSKKKMMVALRADMDGLPIPENN